MRIVEFLAFDEYVPTNADVFTSSELDQAFGACDQIAVIAEVSNVDVTNGSLEVFLQHSADGQNWIDIPTAVVVVPLLFFPTSIQGGSYPPAGSRRTIFPLLAFGRLRIHFIGSTTKGQVKICVTGRDRGAADEVAPLVSLVDAANAQAFAQGIASLQSQIATIRAEEEAWEEKVAHDAYWAPVRAATSLVLAAAQAAGPDKPWYEDLWNDTLGAPLSISKAATAAGIQSVWNYTFGSIFTATNAIAKAKFGDDWFQKLEGYAADKTMGNLQSGAIGFAEDPYGGHGPNPFGGFSDPGDGSPWAQPSSGQSGNYSYDFGDRNNSFGPSSPSGISSTPDLGGPGGDFGEDDPVRVPMTTGEVIGPAPDDPEAPAVQPEDPEAPAAQPDPKAPAAKPGDTAGALLASYNTDGTALMKKDPAPAATSGDGGLPERGTWAPSVSDVQGQMTGPPPAPQPTGTTTSTSGNTTHVDVQAPNTATDTQGFDADKAQSDEQDQKTLTSFLDHPIRDVPPPPAPAPPPAPPPPAPPPPTVQAPSPEPSGSIMVPVANSGVFFDNAGGLPNPFPQIRSFPSTGNWVLDAAGQDLGLVENVFRAYANTAVGVVATPAAIVNWVEKDVLKFAPDQVQTFNDLTAVTAVSEAGPTIRAGLEGLDAMAAELFESDAILTETGGRRVFDATNWGPEVDDAYDAIRAATGDVTEIAKNTGLSADDISLIKDHIFNNTHILDEGVIARFDADPFIANAWQRLVDGSQNPNDLALLQHELFELNYEKTFQTVYRVAHDAAINAGFIWKWEP